MTLGSRAFFIEFLNQLESEKKKISWEKIFEKDKRWTAKMLGTGKSREKGDYGLLGRVAQKFGYTVEAEWRHIDQVWYYWLPKPKGWRKQPWKNNVAVEHENNIRRLEYTLFKFEEISIPLKVGIFYPPEENEDKYLAITREMILKQVSSYPGGVHLIIFGFCDEESGVYWRAYEIDFKGNVIKLHE